MHKTPAHTLLESLLSNPGPGYVFCPICLHGAFTRDIHRTGKASDPVDNATATCRNCGRETPAKWLTWNEALVDAAERVRVVEEGRAA